MEKVYISDHRNKNLSTNKYLLPNQREKEAKALKKTEYVTVKDEHKLTTRQRYILQRHLILVHTEFQHVK